MIRSLLQLLLVVTVLHSVLAFPRMVSPFKELELLSDLFSSQCPKVSSQSLKLQQLTPNDQKRFVRALKGQKLEPRQGFPVIIIPGVPQPVSLTVSGVVTVGRKIIPDAAHPFIAPGPTDQRGGCPGLNMAANYGYINRSGITTAGELLYAQQEMFGFSADLAQVLVALTFRAMTDVTTLKMSIGLTDSRTSGPNSHIFGQAPGLFSSPSHNKYEIDGSLANTDEQFTPNHVGNVFDSTIWGRNERIAAASGGIFNITFNRESRFQTYQNCIANNPQCSWLAVGQALFYGAQCFTFLTFPSTNAAGIQEPPTYDVVRTFMGIKANQDGTFSKVPEEIPAGSTGPWFRRGTPLTTVEIVETVVASYSAHPVVFGANSGHVNSFVASGPQLGADVSVKTAGCLILDNIVQNVPVVADNLVNALLAPAVASLGC